MKVWFAILLAIGAPLACDPAQRGAPAGNSFALEPDGAVSEITSLDSGIDRASTSPPALPTTFQTSEPKPAEEAGVDTPDAAVPPDVAWGLQPGSPAIDAGAVDLALARLEVLALGSRVLTYVSSGEGDDFEPAARITDLAWIVTLPFDAFQAMDATALSAWIQSAWSVGSSVKYLIIGQSLETDLEGVSQAERDAVTLRLERALKEASEHPSKPEGSFVGLGFATMAIVPTRLLAATEVVALSFSGLEPSGSVIAPETAVQRLAALAVEFRRHQVPLVIQDLAYPSWTSAADQQAFFVSLRASFQVQLPDVRAVVVSSLNPPSSEDCRKWASDWGVDEGAELRCSVSMREPNGAPKPALNEVIELLAAFAQL